MLLAEDTLRHGFRLPARVREVPYLNKPPLFFWSVALAALPAGRASDRNAPIPSIVAALGDTPRCVRHRPAALRRSHRVHGPRRPRHQPRLLPAQPSGPPRHDVRRVADLGAPLPPARARVAPSRAAPLVGFYTCVAGALWTKGLPCLMVIPAAVAAVAVTIGVRKLPSFRPVTGLGLVGLTALPWAVPYVRAPDLEGSQAVSLGQGLSWYLDHFRHHPSVLFVDGLIEFLPWTLWLVPAAVWWRLTPDRRAYRPVFAWMAVFLLLLAPDCPAARTLHASRLSAVRAVRRRVGDGSGIARPIPAQDPRHDPRRRARHGLGRGRMASPCSAAVQRDLDVRLPRGRALGARQPRGVVIAGPAIALWALRVHCSPSRALAWIAATLALVFLLGAGIYSASLASANSIRAFADHVRGSLERDAPIMAFPDASLIFDFYLGRSIVEVPRRNRVASHLESPAVGEVLMRVGDWAHFRPSAHPSWCPIGEAKVETRAYVLSAPAGESSRASGLGRPVRAHGDPARLQRGAEPRPPLAGADRHPRGALAALRSHLRRRREHGRKHRSGSASSPGGMPGSGMFASSFGGA